MEHVDKARAELKKVVMTMPEFVAFCEKNGLPADLVLGGGIAAFVLVGVILQGYNIICALLTCVYPMICSIKTIESEDDDETKNWLSFWTVFGFFQIIEMFAGFILNFIPYYGLIRILFFIYLMAPQTNGAHTFYSVVLKPYLRAHEKEIKAFIEKVQAQAEEAKKQGLSKASEIATTENMMKAAAAAQDAQQKINDLKEESEKKDE